jgi:hypothetical protein
MNIYYVVSEDVGNRDHYGHWDEPPEPRVIAALVVARNHSQARWLAWKADSLFDPDPREMPKFSARCVRKDVDLPAGIVSDRREFRDLWYDDLPAGPPSSSRDLVLTSEFDRAWEEMEDGLQLPLLEWSLAAGATQ